MLAAIEGRSTKRRWLKAIRGLLQAAVPTMRRDDPTEGIAGIKMPKTKGHHTWTDEEIAQYRAYWPLGTQQRLVMEFALETASRRGEVVRFGPQHIRNGRIRIERTHGSEDVDMPMSPELQAACDAMPKVHLTYIITAHGKPRSKYGLGNDFVVIMFLAVVLGGLGSVPGATFGAFIVGLVQSLSGLFLPLQLQNVTLFVVFVVILLVRPQGLFGHRQRV